MANPELRFVAFLDILGFADLVTSEPLDMVKGRISESIHVAKKAVSDGAAIGFEGIPVKGVRLFSFSDTFVVLSEDASPAAFLSFLNATTVLTRELFAKSLPVRGGITFGEADFIPNTDHAIGEGIIAAARLEKSQDWLGVIVDEKTIPIPLIPLLSREIFAPLFVRWNVPTKANGESAGAAIGDALVLNWLYNVKFKSGAESAFRTTTNADALRKIAHSLKFVAHIRREGRDRGPTEVCNFDGEPIYTPSLRVIE